MLVLDAGDALNGEQGLGLMTKGQIQVDAMNLMGYDAMALGSGDIIIGWESLAQRMAEARFPMLSANLIRTGTGELIGKPYMIRELTPQHRVAIIGLTDPYAATLATTIGEAPVEVLDPVEAARRYVDELSGQADIIVVLSHLGFEEDQRLSREVPEIDVIVGGKSGHIFDPPTRPYADGPVVAQAGQLGQRLGVVRLDFDANGQVIQWDGHVVTLGVEAAEDPSMEDLIRRYEAEWNVTPAP